MKRYILSGLLSLLITGFSIAQNKNNVHFYNLNDKFGISLRETNSVCADDDGFIWVSSKMGIIRYTQDDIRIYQLPYESTNVVTAELTYSQNELYVYTNAGQIFKYNTIRDRFELLINLSRVLRNPYLGVSAMLVDEGKRLWISSTAGLFHFSEEKGLKATTVVNNVLAMTWYDTENIIYAEQQELRLFNIQELVYKPFYRFPTSDGYNISTLVHDEQQDFWWIGTMGSGLFVFDSKAEPKLYPIENIPGQPILAIENFTASSVLIGIDGQGVWELDKNSHDVLAVMKENADNMGSLKGNGVYDIYRDTNNRVWVCTYSGGVSYMDMANPVITQINHIANNQNSLVNNDVNAVLEDSNGNYWFATNNGISFRNNATGQWKSFYYNNEKDAQVFLTLKEDSRGRIWAGTYSSGVYLLDNKTGAELKHLSLETTGGKFGNNYVFEIIDDQEGQFWIGGVRGDLICYDIKTDTYRSLLNVTVGKLLNYKENKLLIGNTNGLILFDKNSGRTETIVEGYIVNDIFLKDNVAWLCTVGSGVIRYDFITREQENFTVDNGLPSNFVSSIQYMSGYFWIGTEQGLCRLKPSDRSVLTFNALPAVSNVSYNLRAIQVLGGERLMMGTNNGALIFDPNEIKPVQNRGSIFLQELSVSGRSIRELESPSLTKPLNDLEKLSLKYAQNTISLEMLPIGVTSPGARFSWKMEDLDAEWTKPANNKILSYSNIPSGNYTLRIKMYDSSNTQLLAERDIKLYVIPPYWATWWFRILIILFVFGLVVFIMVYYIENLKKVHSEEKIRFFANTAHDIRTSLTLLKGPVEELNKEPVLTSKGHHYLHLATEQTQRLLNVVTQLMDFQKSDIGKERISLQMVDVVKAIKNRVMMFESYGQSKNIEIHFKSNLSKFVTAIDETLIDKVVDNLISNAIKYSNPDSHVNVSLNCTEHRWVLEVQDFGIGISKKAQRQLFKEYYRAENVVNSKIVGSGIGLLLVKNYVNLHGGRINCLSQLNEGSTFQVLIPTKALNEEPVVRANTQQKGLQVPVTKQEFSPVVPNEDEEPEALKMKVLIVEDNEYLREFLKTAMEPQFQVYLAKNGVQAWELIQKQTPDLVVSDIMMPEMDGFELCRKIKSTYETSHLPVILLTALAGKAEQLKGLGLGADDYLTKPFDVSILQQRIRSLVGNRKLIREKAIKIINGGDDAVIVENELNDKFLKRMVEVIHENMANAQFSKKDFASAMHVSPSLLYKKVKSLTDQSPTDFIKMVRLNHSLELLRTKQYNITEVSELCGFASVGYFSTVFRKHFGKSPTQMIG
jgi:signal transduction histidine kinase/CheY-like chemotaxis protein/ligand-binding sensor domain-containing protein/AraC-like DNA-binding protein